MKHLSLSPDDRVLVLGATGFIGSRLIRELAQKNIRMRLLVRNASKASALVPKKADAEIIEGDILKNINLQQALKGIHSAYYLVHSMGGKLLSQQSDFAEKDKQAARNFVSAADASGLKRVIYLGGLGETGDNLSEHLRSRLDVAKILSEGKAKETFLRAAVIIGAGGASFEMLRYLVERLPVMTAPQWIDTRIQPIAVQDVLAYLAGCLLDPETAGRTFDICGHEVLTYREMMEQYAEARQIAKRFIVTVPFLTPKLSSYWVDLITPVPAGVAHPLIEGLKNEVVCRDSSIDEFVPIQKTSFQDAVKLAFSEETTGPGVTGF
ncbi:MAG: NAD(P)H-binding protein [Nitrospirota bacterium]|nr:NAD(P)H-binding protein [Nitrospirota bacterium]